MSQLTLFNVPINPQPIVSLPRYVPGLSLRCEYLAVISPPPQIRDALYGMKADLDRLLGGGHKWRWSKPHITLFMVKAARVDEGMLTDVLRHGCARHDPFPLRFRGYGHFQESRTLFVNPIEKAPVEELGVHLETIVRLQESKQPKKVSESPYPHMTIGKGLFGRGQFEKAMKFFEDRPYSAEMCVDRVLLLRRGVNPVSRYDAVCEFMLGLPSKTDC